MVPSARASPEGFVGRLVHSAMAAEKDTSPMEEDKPASPNGNAEAEKDAAGGPKKDRKPGAEAAKEEDGEEDLSEEDAALKEQLELLVERVQDTDAGVQKLALDTIRSEIRSATSSMTSVPKPLKFLRPHYGTLKDFFARMPAGDNKVRFGSGSAVKMWARLSEVHHVKSVRSLLLSGLLYFALCPVNDLGIVMMRSERPFST